MEQWDNITGKRVKQDNFKRVKGILMNKNKLYSSKSLVIST